MSSTFRNVLIVIIALLVLIILGLVGWYFFLRGSSTPTSTASSTPVSVTTTTTASAPPAAAHLTNSNQYYTADMEYPPSTPLAQTASASADAMAVQTMKTAAQNTINTFIKDGNLTNPPQGEIDSMQGQQYSLSSSYQIYKGSETVSYVFTIVEDTLGAHPNASFATFTFDSKTGQAIPLYNIFNSGADYLDSLSSLSRAALTTQEGSAADPTFIDPGTTPDNTNFQDFALDGSNLDLFFAPYEVAPYSSGPQTVKIPLSKLSNLLKTEYQ